MNTTERKLIAIIGYFASDDETELHTTELASIARALDALHGAEIITHPQAWLTANGRQEVGTASLVFGTHVHLRTLAQLRTTVTSPRIIFTLLETIPPTSFWEMS